MTNKEIYKALCDEPNDLPLFHQYWWLDAVCNNWDVAITRNGENISGVWPYTIEQKLGVSILRDPTLTAYLGPHVIYPFDLKESKKDSFEHDTIEALLEQIPQTQVWSTALIPNIKQVGLFQAKGFDVAVKQTFIMPLKEDEEMVFSRLNEDYRRNVRKAAKEITITNEPDLLHELWHYQNATLAKKDVAMHFSKEQLAALYKACSDKQSTALWVARREGVVQAIIWQVWDASRAYYLVGSKNPSANDNRVMTALLWHAIKHAKELGKKSFDFEGSMDTGVEKFFRNFGGNRTLYLILKKNKSTLWKLKELVR